MRVGLDGLKSQTAGVAGLLPRPAAPEPEEARERWMMSELTFVARAALGQVEGCGAKTCAAVAVAGAAGAVLSGGIGTLVVGKFAVEATALACS